MGIDEKGLPAHWNRLSDTVQEIDFAALKQAEDYVEAIVRNIDETRTSTDAGHPTEAIDAVKQRRMTQAAVGYLKSKRLLDVSARFDVVAVTWPADSRRPRIEHFKNAFDATGMGQFFS
jgi:putative endonuclease